VQVFQSQWTNSNKSQQWGQQPNAISLAKEAQKQCHWINTLNSNPPGQIKLSSQSTAGVRLCCAFYQPLHPVQKCWAKTILLSQTCMFCLFFIQFVFAGSHTEHQWSCSQSILELTASTTWRKSSKPSTSQNDHNEGWGLDEKQELIPCIVQSQVERIDIFSKCKKYLQISAICQIKEEYDTCVALETYVHVQWRNVGTLTTWTYIHKYWKLTTIKKRELSYNTKAGTSAPIPACCCPQGRWTWIVKRTLFCIYSILLPPRLVCRN
jgi:hypothetical protein